MALSEDNQVAFRVAHLSLIQGAIERMSGFSAHAKNFTITILAGLAAISFQADALKLGVIAITSTMILGVIDVYYLTLELRFRSFYDHVRCRDLVYADDLSIKPLKRTGDIFRALNSIPIKLFYLPVLSACVLLIGYGLIYGQRTVSKRLFGSTPTRVEQSADAPAKASVPRLAKPVIDQSTRDAGQQSRKPDPASTRQPIRSETPSAPAAR